MFIGSLAPTPAEQLQQAVVNDDPNRCRALLAEGVSPEGIGQQSDGRTLMHLAALYGYLEVAQALRAAGAQIDPLDRGGNSPLHLAAYKDHPKLCTWLAEQGADVNRQDGSMEKRRPLHAAVSQSASAACEALIEVGADVNGLDGQKRRPLDSAYYAMPIATLEKFIRAGADLQPGPAGWEYSMINHLASIGHTQQALFLIAHGAAVCPKVPGGTIYYTRKIDGRDATTYTAKTAAARGGFSGRLLQLLEQEPVPTSRRDHVSNLLAIARRTGQDECFAAIQAHQASAAMRKIRQAAALKGVQGLGMA